MRLTTIAHYLIPFVAFAGGIFVLLRPQLLNYIVAVYLILVGSIGLNRADRAKPVTWWQWLRSTG